MEWKAAPLIYIFSCHFIASTALIIAAPPPSSSSSPSAHTHSVMKWDEFPIQPVHLTTFISWIIEKRPPCYSSHAFVYPGLSCLSFRVLALPLLSPLWLKTHFPSDWTIDGTVMMLGFSLLASERHINLIAPTAEYGLLSMRAAILEYSRFLLENYSKYKTANLRQTTTDTKVNKKKNKKK